MLSQETICTVKSTVPLLADHGLSITTNFYERLFDNHPDLQHIFNRNNQRNGTQARALADAVFAYASNIDNLEELLPVVERIAHKHASLGVSPEQYAVVGENLLGAIQSVLDLPADHAALQAWGEAYGVLADVFINAEENIYQENENTEGGWRGFREFVIDRIEVETPEVKSFYLKPVDGGKVPTHKAGQYVGIRVNPDHFTYDEIRQYSLSDYNRSDGYRITTKVEHEGLVTNFMHDCSVGDALKIQPPTGVFTLNNNAKRQVFIAGGVGITPLMSMLYEALEGGHAASDICFIQCARDSKQLIFADEIKRMAGQHQFDYKVSLDMGDSGDHAGYLNEDILKAWIGGTDADVYFCGPNPFMSALNKILLGLGFTSEQLHYEAFGPDLGL